MKVEKYGIGTIHKTKEGYDIEIIEYVCEDFVKIKFFDKYNTEILVKVNNLKELRIKNPNKNTVCGGIARYGVGKYNDSYVFIYDIWHNMLTRVYKEYYLSRRPNYRNVTICEDWHNFQNFAEWYDKTYPYHIKGIKFQLDKDITQWNVENKIYSPETCIWLPCTINTYVSKPKGSGIFWYENRHKWMGYNGDFSKNKRIHLGYFKTKEECENVVNAHKLEQDSKAREYLRSLNYLPEEIIQLVRTV